jgi:hypothetical protein
MASKTAKQLGSGGHQAPLRHLQWVLVPLARGPETGKTIGG